MLVKERALIVRLSQVSWPKTNLIFGDSKSSRVLKCDIYNILDMSFQMKKFFAY